MICRADNATKIVVKGAKDYSMKEKLCLCDEENGYMENVVDKHCSGKQHYLHLILIYKYPFIIMAFIIYLPN